MDEDDILDGKVTYYNNIRKKHYDEDINERINQFEIVEHPYC